jgi:hypothetical protein
VTLKRRPTVRRHAWQCCQIFASSILPRAIARDGAPAKLQDLSTGL